MCPLTSVVGSVVVVVLVSGIALLVKCPNISSASAFAMSPRIIASRNSFCFNNVKICRQLGYLQLVPLYEGLHDELGVVPSAEIRQVVEVIHERFIFEVLALSEI